MRILYLATSFPEPNAGATIYTDLAEAINEAGHEIVVAVSEQARNKRHNQLEKERGFYVLRIVTGNYYDVGFIHKGITTLKIPVLMRAGIKKYLNGMSFDLIIFESPPVTSASSVEWAKKQFNCKAYLMLKDIFPQNAVDLGIMKHNSLLFRYFAAKEKKLYKTSDYIGCMSSANKHYIITHNPLLNPDKLEVFPNTKKISLISDKNNSKMREHFNIPKEACIFLFGGNMGRPQCVELLCESIKALKENADIYFLFIGRGADRYKLEKTIIENNIKNAQVVENLPRIEYEETIKECDVGLIVLDPRFTIPNYPSRILSYMEYSKPILAATDHVTDIKSLIEEAECGLWTWSGDINGFIAKIKEMAKSDKLKYLGANGRKYMESKFDVKYSVKLLEDHFDVNKSVSLPEKHFAK